MTSRLSFQSGDSDPVVDASAHLLTADQAPFFDVLLCLTQRTGRLYSFEEGDHLLAGDAGETVEEFLNRIATLEVIDQILDGHARARKTGRTAHNLGIDFDDGAHFIRSKVF